MTPTVNILGLTHKVEIVPNLSANWDTLGDISYNEQPIRLDAGLSEERRAVVLLHGHTFTSARIETRRSTSSSCAPRCRPLARA